MEIDNQNLEDEILYVLRRRLSAKSIAAKHVLRDYVLAQISVPADQRPGEADRLVVNTIEESIRYHMPSDKSDLRNVVQLLAGLDPRTSGWNLTREAIAKIEAEELTRIRSGKYPRLSKRRVEQVERQTLAPAVLEALNAMLSKTRPSKHRWGNCDLDLRLYGDGGEGVLLRLQQTFSTVQSRLLFVVTEDGALADGMCSRYPEVTDVFVPSSDVAANTVVNTSVMTSDGEVHLQVQEASSQDIAPGLLSDLHDRGIDEVYVVDLPPDDAFEGSDVRLTSVQRLSLDERFCYWTAPREALLGTVRFDYSGFPSASGFSFRVRPRLGFQVNVQHQPALQQFEIDVDAWVPAGCGFQFLWRPLDEPE